MPTSSTIEIGPSVEGGPVYYRTRSRVWSNTPGYATIAKYDLPINSYSDFQQSVTQTPTRSTERSIQTGTIIRSDPIRYTSGPDMVTTINGVYALAEAPTGIQTTLENEALLKALARVSDSKVNIGVALAEASKTSDLILSSASRILGAYRGFRRGNLREISRNLNISPKKLHKSWLEYKYGWMPLLMDVKNGAEFFAQQHCGRPIVFTVSAKAAFEKVLPSNNYRDNTYSPGSNYGYTAKDSRVVKVKLRCRIDNPHLTAIQQLGLTNPALVVWELVPFSFVFDWFISVGDYLQGLTALHGITVTRAMKSYLIVKTGDYHSRALAHSFPLTDVRKSGYLFTIRGLHRSYSRAPLSVSLTGLRPSVNRDPFNMNRLVTSLALIRAQGSRLNIRA